MVRQRLDSVDIHKFGVGSDAEGEGGSQRYPGVGIESLAIS